MRSPSLEGPLFGSCDDLVLEIGADVNEVVAVARNANDQVAILLRRFLGAAQRGRVNHVDDQT